MHLLRLRWKKVVLASFGVAAMAATVAVIALRQKATPDVPKPNHLSDARTFFRSERFAEAEEAANRELSEHPSSAEALLIAAEVASKAGRYKQAIKYYQRVPEDAGRKSVQAQFGRGEVSVQLGRLSDAEAWFRRALQADPHHIASNFRLTYLLAITGRGWEASRYALRLVQKNKFVMSHMLLLGDFDRVVESDGHLEMCRKEAPDDPLPQLGMARIELDANRVKEAHRLLRKAVTHRPDLLQAQACLGETLLLLKRFNDMSQWHAALPDTADSHPDIWFTRGLWCQQQDQTKAAIRCFIEAVRIEPDHKRANLRLGQLLQSNQQPKLAAPFLNRAERLQRLSSALDALRIRGSESIVRTAMREIVEVTESLGRLWEAQAWVGHAVPRPLPVWAVRVLQRLKPRLTHDLPKSHPANNPTRSMSVTPYPLPVWGKFIAASPTKNVGKSMASDIRFRDRAQEVGIQFVYFNAGDSKTPGERIFETTGGGVAVIDFDGDAWPDLYFTQGSSLPKVETSFRYRDRLYRNLGGDRFVDVTSSAGLGDANFSQGVNVGDFDGDGFPDIYVANMGINRLYRNNGDGTFTDVAEASGIASAEWTSSCLVADLNADGLPDLYDVNYIARDNLFRVCQRNGSLTACSPLVFSPAQDRVLINRGDGRFQDVTRTAGIERPKGYGLGIVAADFFAAGRLSLFVANDLTANFFFVNRSTKGGSIVFDEKAHVAGVAFDVDGKTQGCMGVAVGDANGDARLDLFVTNFYKESNTLYLGLAGRCFSDETRRANLRDVGYMKLGFGTQFLDVDLDGRPDLVVANGHVADHSRFGEPYQMPPQLFRNSGNGRFLEVAADSLGDYFQRKWLGRGLARIDWNRDGREDYVVSNIGAPAALVTNETPLRNNFLTVRLRGTSSCRDAIGSTVRITIAGRSVTRQLTAGDGYMASNQRQLVFGTGTADRVDDMTVIWPSGDVQVFRNLSANSELLIVEGAPFPLSLPR